MAGYNLPIGTSPAGRWVAYPQVQKIDRNTGVIQTQGSNVDWRYDSPIRYKLPEIQEYRTYSYDPYSKQNTHSCLEESKGNRDYYQGLLDFYRELNPKKVKDEEVVCKKLHCLIDRLKK